MKRRVYRVIRGGSFNSDTRGLRTAYRYWYEPEDRFWYVGFRVVKQRRKR